MTRLIPKSAEQLTARQACPDASKMNWRLELFDVLEIAQCKGCTRFCGLTSIELFNREKQGELFEKPYEITRNN